MAVVISIRLLVVSCRCSTSHLAPARLRPSRVADQVSPARRTFSASLSYYNDGFSVRLVGPAVVALPEGAYVVDFAGVVQIVLDHDADDPPRLFHLTPVRLTRLQQFAVVEPSNALAK